MRFVGYSRHPEGYRLLNESIGRIVIQRDVTFNEERLLRMTPLEMIIETTSEERDEAIQPEVEHQRPARQIRPPVRCGVDEYVDTASCSVTDQACHTAYYASQIVEPTTMKEAMVLQSGRELRVTNQ